MSENFGNHRGIFNSGNDFQGTTTVRAVLNVNIEYPFTRTFPSFCHSGRQRPFKTASEGFVGSRTQLM